MKPILSLLSALALTSACHSDALPMPEPTPAAAADSLAADVAAAKADTTCIPRDQRCTTGGARCCTGFCASTGYYGYGYGSGTCSAFLVDHSYCQADAECESKHCSDYVCVE
jgi:hypothetical protein